MGRQTLFRAGFAGLAAAAWLLIASEAGWLPGSDASRWGLLLGKVAASALVVGLLLAIVAPVFRWAGRGRCVRCGAACERGQTYCLDHLSSTMHEARDQVRERMSQRRSPGRRA